MLIENPDAFKSWLTSVLEPLCDADPEALAKYVFALVKKDKTAEVLRDSMIEQLDVFLQSETKNFVDLLFKTIDTQDYLLIPNINPPNPNLIEKKSPEISLKDIKPVIQVSSLPNLSDSLKKATAEDVVPAASAPQLASKRDASDKCEKPREPVDAKRDVGHARRRNRSRSRSRSYDRSRRRSWRNKSPPRRSWRRSPRSISPEHPSARGYRGPRYRNRSPPKSPRDSRSRTRSRSRSRSVDKKERRDKDKERDEKRVEENSGGATPTQDSNHGDTDMRLTSQTQSIQSVIPLHPSSAAATPGAPQQQQAAPARCRDFDERGFCMKGEYCLFDHGLDPVILEDTALSRVLAFPGPIVAPAPPVLTQNAPNLPQNAEYNPLKPQMYQKLGYRQPNFRTNSRELISIQTNDRNAHQDAANQKFAPKFGKKRFANNFQHLGENKNLVTFENYGEFEGNFEGPVNKIRKGFDYSRLGPLNRGKNGTNCSLLLKKIPKGLNNITHLNNHFSKFGKITNIQVQFENDAESALVTFSSHAEANAAFKSTEAVLNNRFIKIFWYSESKGGEIKIKDRLGLKPELSADKNDENLLRPANFGDKSPAKPQPKLNKQENQPTAAETAEKSAQTAKTIEKIDKIKELKKKQEEQKREAFKLTQNLRKRKQELLEKQLAQQKLLIEKLEKTPNGPHRNLLKSTIKTVQDSIESIRSELFPQKPPQTTLKPTVTNVESPSAAAPVAATPKYPKTREQTQKEILDTELDLISRQNEGLDTSDLKRKLLELKALAKSYQKVVPTPAKMSLNRKKPPHRIFNSKFSKNNLTKSTTNPLLVDANPSISQNAVLSKSNVVDNRSRTLLVSGYETDEVDAVLTQFGQYGEILNYTTDNSTPSLTLTYKLRKDAETALINGRHFSDRLLSVTWVQRPPGANLQPMKPVEVDTILKVDILEDAKVPDENPSTPEVAQEPVDVVEQTVETPLLEEAPAPAEEEPQEKEDQLLEGDEENILGSHEYTEEVLLQDDEEDDETEDDRSWRRSPAATADLSDLPVKHSEHKTPISASDGSIASIEKLI